MPHSGVPGGVTFFHALPVSRVSQTRPSSVPAHSVPLATGDAASTNTVSKYSTLVMSSWIGPPDGCCFDLSLRVRSFEIAVQVLPSSLDRHTIWLAV